MTWTQEQQNAAMQFVADAAREFSPEGCLDRHAVSQVTFELACQRNELLEALKDITNLACGWQGSYEWRQKVTQKAKAAIAKAEGK